MPKKEKGTDPELPQNLAAQAFESANTAGQDIHTTEKTNVWLNIFSNNRFYLNFTDQSNRRGTETSSNSLIQVCMIFALMSLYLFTGVLSTVLLMSLVKALFSESSGNHQSTAPTELFQWQDIPADYSKPSFFKNQLLSNESSFGFSKLLLKEPMIDRSDTVNHSAALSSHSQFSFNRNLIAQAPYSSSLTSSYFNSTDAQSDIQSENFWSRLNLSPSESKLWLLPESGNVSLHHLIDLTPDQYLLHSSPKPLLQYPSPANSPDRFDLSSGLPSAPSVLPSSQLQDLNMLENAEPIPESSSSWGLLTTTILVVSLKFRRRYFRA
jgi:hypothetical protein